MKTLVLEGSQRVKLQNRLISALQNLKGGSGQCKFVLRRHDRKTYGGYILP